MKIDISDKMMVFTIGFISCLSIIVIAPFFTWVFDYIFKTNITMSPVYSPFLLIVIAGVIIIFTRSINVSSTLDMKTLIKYFILITSGCILGGILGSNIANLSILTLYDDFNLIFPFIALSVLVNGIFFFQIKKREQYINIKFGQENTLNS